MELQEYVRKPFPVKAVEITFQNAYEVAEWCRGRVELKSTRLLGGAGKGVMDLPTVVFKGTGDNRDKEFTGGLGDFIVELRGSFRVFKKQQFRATFDKVEPKVEVPDEVRKSIQNDGAYETEDEAIADQEREEAEHRHGHDNSSIDGQETIHVSL